MRFVSWNVNGLRACVGKGFYESMRALDADVVCVQEIKLKRDQLQNDMAGYEAYWNFAEKPGYSGTAIFTRVKPGDVIYGIGDAAHDSEGRSLACDFGAYYLVCVYAPNSQRELTRLEYRMQWEDAFFKFVKELEQGKPVIICGDLNVAHKEIDLKHPSANRMSAGFTDAERGKLTRLIDSGFTDTFRRFNPDARDVYTWWSYIGNARSRNTGWRIDYFLTSKALDSRLVSAGVHADIYGSDHCPVSLTLDA